MKLAHLATILLGVFLIALIVPISQFLTIRTLNLDLETASPVGWAVGLVFSLVLALAAIRLVARTRILDKTNLVILYSMLTLAVPVMNIGLVRPMFLAINAAQKEYLVQGTDTYRTIYNHQSEAWFPKVPTREGLAWNKADRLLTMLRDESVVRQRLQAKARVMAAVQAEQLRPGTADGAAGPQADVEALGADLARLGADDMVALKEWIAQAGMADAVARLGLTEVVAAELERSAAASAEAAGRLPALLEGVDEFAVSELPQVRPTLPSISQTKNETRRSHMTQAQVAALDREVADLVGRADELRALVTSLSDSHRTRVRSEVQAGLMDAYAAMDQETFDEIRGSFVFRLTQRQRHAMSSQDGRGGTPDQNLSAFARSVWISQRDRQMKESRTGSGWSGWTENLQEVRERLPWGIWVRPMVMWGLLFTTIFLLLMCVAEWLRRKWIARENLAFPLVEVADNFLRHDYSLETAEDMEHPQPRLGLFSGLFLLGLGVGLLWVGLEGLYHYGESATAPRTAFNVSAELFTTGALREMSNVALVISPIVLGIAFLVSLEVSFSIWVIFFLYNFLVLAVRIGDPQIRDSLYTGWGGGRHFPFPMEQMMGAAICFTAILMYKAIRSQKRHVADTHDTNYFIPPRLNLVGLIGLPVVLAVLLWHYGILAGPVALVTSPSANIGSWLLVLLMGGFVGAQTIAQARVRAETGLHTHHVSYEFTRLPMALGLTGLTGAGVFTQFISLAFLPMTLLFRSLAQLLENMELARRNRMKLRVIAIAGLAAFVVAISVGMLSFLVYSHYYGEPFQGVDVYGAEQYKQGPANAGGLAHYPLWVAHFQGEYKLDQFTSVSWVRVWFILLGLGVFGLLTLLRNRFLRFPLHPIGYMVILFSISYEWVTPYFKGDNVMGKESTFLWGSVFLAWLIKKLIIKYGGMNTYKKAKPFFVGLVVGAVFSVFLWNMLDLGATMLAQWRGQTSGFFVDKLPFTPRFY